VRVVPEDTLEMHGTFSRVAVRGAEALAVATT
jgi:hypothetical protein